MKGNWKKSLIAPPADSSYSAGLLTTRCLARWCSPLLCVGKESLKVWQKKKAAWVRPCQPKPKRAQVYLHCLVSSSHWVQPKIEKQRTLKWKGLQPMLVGLGERLLSPGQCQGMAKHSPDTSQGRAHRKSRQQ